jgi:HSP20 family protein
MQYLKGADMAGALTRWEPFTEFGDLRSRLDQMLDRLARPDGGWAPAIDVVRDDGNLVVRADVPGIKPEEIKVEVEDGVLTVSGEHEQSDETKNADYVRRERSYGSFSRSLVLPSGVDAGAIKATTRDGVAEVTIPLPQEARNEKVTITPTAS